MIRIHHTNQEVIRVPFPYPKLYRQKLGYKPNGLWYGINWEWEEWCKSEMPKWLHKKHFSLEIDMNKILLLDSTEKIMDFQKEFGEMPDWMNDGLKRIKNHEYINWEKVAEKYSGIEISPYQYSLRFKLMWYYGWDIASGCIFNLSCIKSINLITEKEKIK